uniref:HAT C-terminal dimerisation domain-containing protein n=1 Tax=Meloidogyne javanica TaxID=6303 RepID=A0A915LI63_MELJA
MAVFLVPALPDTPNSPIQQQRALTLAYIEFQELKLPDFELIKMLSVVLKPFDTFTKQLSKRDEAISSVLPVYRCLISVLIEKDSDNTIIKNFKRIVANGLKTRMTNYEKKRFLIISTLVDPRYKNHPNVFDFADRIQKKAILQSEIEFIDNPELRSTGSGSHTEIANNQSNNPLTNFLMSNTNVDLDESLSVANNPLSLSIRDEIEAFFKSPTLDLEEDPLKYWKQNTDYMRIKQLVPRYLSPPSGTVESERTFSKLSEIYSQRRSNLSSEHAKQQLFLHFNFDE